MAEPNPNARMEAFSEGVFAIAMTLLILDIKLPSPETIHSTGEFWMALWRLIPSILAFLLSFTIILITWVNHHASFRLVERTSVSLAYANGFLLLTVVFLPFPTALLGAYVLTDHAAPAVILYDAIQAVQSVAWIWLGTTILNHGLAKNAQAEARGRASTRYGYYGLVIYTACAVLAGWFPLAIAIVTVLMWAGWIIAGMKMRME